MDRSALCPTHAGQESRLCCHRCGIVGAGDRGEHGPLHRGATHAAGPVGGSASEQLRLLAWTEPKGGAVENLWGWFDDLPGGGETSTSFSYPVYQQLRKQNSAMESLFAFKTLDRQTVTVDGHAEAVTAEMVSGNYYSSLEVWPQLGRGIQESDDGPPGSGPVVVISDRFWTREFARSPHVIGKTILFNMTPMTIIGVNPRGFTGAFSAQETPDVFFPFSMQPIAAPLNIGESTLLLCLRTRTCGGYW